jgi:formyltetrahydrofolate deformylase
LPQLCTLSVSCPDRPGLVARVAGFLAERGCNIVDAQQFNDSRTERFFMRVQFSLADRPFDAIRGQFAFIGEELGLEWKMRLSAERMKVLVMVSKFDHCLDDLLYRNRIGELDMDVAGIVSNHPMEALNTALIGDVPYFHLPVTRDSKPQQEAEVRRIIEQTGAELVVLARYMQILSDEFSAWLAGRCINIHHSFLPGFKGAKPYHQAHERGVKMIGATAHYVTADLDEGPIIAQEVVSITHADTPEMLVAKGRDIERRVLAHAVRAHIEDRVFLNGRRTVVFSG